ncbi:MAG: chromosome partitioning protein ParB [Bacteroides sp.]|nr:hypothetical protein [Eubacterium sp.]MCM1419294.1 hypothetical protein [Roseburia sp.]MCM1463418.1 chromosome partitioning protein ParB [Bacteroides sp.]
MRGETYEEFVEKFKPKPKPKLTTDDCYTPPAVYEAVADWVAGEYGVDRESFVRPFYPGGDYENLRYGDGEIVVDNPPFSILSKITDFYGKRGIRFFLFAPTLTILTRKNAEYTMIVIRGDITYENGAEINTSFITNLDDPEIVIRTAPTIYRAVKEADEKGKARKKLPKYKYPGNIVTAAKLYLFSERGIDLKIGRSESTLIAVLDAQKEKGKEKGIYGKGLLVSDRVKERIEQAEREWERERERETWELSEREKEIVRRLNEGGSEGK